jgi:hypothetical protein
MRVVQLRHAIDVLTQSFQLLAIQHDTSVYRNFHLRHEPSGAILFMGVVRQPSEWARVLRV